MNITTVLVLVFAVACRCGEPGGDVGLVADGRFVESGELIRDQLFFVGEEPEKILTAWVFRWRHMPAVAELDAWAFTGHQGEVETFQVGRILVIGDEQDAGGQNWEIMGIEWLQEGSRLMVSIPGMTIQAPSLTNAGQGRDSHGVVSWHSSAATLSRNGRISTGQLVVERLRGTVDEPMGQCETWLFQPGRGGLVLGRQWYGEPTHGEALQMPPDGRAGPTNFTSTIVSTDEKTGMQAVERKYPTKPSRPGLIERREFEYIRHGTLCLTANFEIATGKILPSRIAETRTNEDFLEHISTTIADDPAGCWIFVVDNLDPHKSCKLVAFRR